MVSVGLLFLPDRVLPVDGGVWSIGSVVGLKFARIVANLFSFPAVYSAEKGANKHTDSRGFGSRISGINLADLVSKTVSSYVELYSLL